MIATDLPLTLYVHVPWCVRKCPYCDFNSHPLNQLLPEARFIDALFQDLEYDQSIVGARPLTSIFIGGGTPSLLSGAAVTRLLTGIHKRWPLVSDIEITLEANPGVSDAQRFIAYRQAGVNRLSLGIQSFNGEQLAALGRIHGPHEALAAINLARVAGFEQLNLDLMFGLPGQTVADALNDLEQALAAAPTHLSWYQLTLEPHTLFYQMLPPLPDEDQIWDMQERGQALLKTHGMMQYEVSAYAQLGQYCQHNINYWQFGDYLGIGPGAHAKLTKEDGCVWRLIKHTHPEAYLRATVKQAESQKLNADDLTLEFLMNALRLREGFSLELFTARTGLAVEKLQMILAHPRIAELLDCTDGRMRANTLGYRFLNTLLARVSVALGEL